MRSRRQLWLVLGLRACLFAAGAAALVLGASGQVSALLSEALQMLSIVALVCHRSCPVRRVAARVLGVRTQPPQSLVRSGTALTRR
ncbi:MAG TPA: hypothetical protein VG388_07555 [Solirubrobacteraceae bacterium]|nr:hypothetical protein [Solirubrobacteraceae bacterium]